MNEPRAFGYLGWIGHANLGDDAIAEVLTDAVAPVPVLEAPMSLRDGRAVRRDDERRRGLSGAVLLLGGGTVIGRLNWRFNLGIALRACGPEPARMIGAGVEDPSFHGRRSFSGFGELARWSSLLRERFAAVTVRGPRSAELLAAVGVDATVVGDPALLARMQAVPVDGGPVVVALGYGDALRGGDQGRVVDAVTAALARVDRPVRAVAVNPSDLRWARQLAERLPQVEVRLATDLRAFDAVLDGAGVVLAERLHAGILAAAAGFSPVLLAYQPKVDDFAASIGKVAHDTSGVSVDDLVMDLSRSAGVSERAATAAQVAVLRHRLTDQVLELRSAAGIS